MQTTTTLKHTGARRRGSPPSKRDGSTLMIVMVLMGMLSLLGVIFYTFAAQERSNANYYAEAAKIQTAPSLTADILFDWALEQIIVGTDQRLKNSMLWGTRHSLLANELGYGFHRPGDLHAFNGQGVNVIFDPSGYLGVDQNRDGIVEPGNSYLLNYNNSPAANSLFERNLRGEDTNWNGVLDAGEDQNGNGVLDGVVPQTDVGYTYPDINNVFLCYVGKVRDGNGNIHRVIKPSYLVPGLLRSPNGAGFPAPLTFEDTNLNGKLDAGEDTNGNGYLDDWCVNPNTKAMVMRAHPNHLYVPPNTSTATPANRYLTDAEATVLIGPSARGFPFHPMAKNYDTTSGGLGALYDQGRMGVYTNVDSLGIETNEPIEFDYDNDGDDRREAILMDLDFPVQQDASGKLFVPMFLITIHDLDALINLNAHGNISKILYGPQDQTSASTAIASSAGFPFGYDTSLATFDFISKSNLGLGPAEINPAWVLNARPPVTSTSYPGDGTGGNFAPHSTFFGGDPRNNNPSPAWGEVANQELLWTKIGRPIYSGASITDLTPGVYGEEGRLYQSIVNSTLSVPGGLTLPRPGFSVTDDNADAYEGQANPSTFGFFTSTNWDFQHPLDFTGQGSFLANAKTIKWNTSMLPSRWITYNRYNNSSTSTTNSYVKWGQYSGFMTNSLTQGLGDDPYEVRFYGASTTGGSDNTFDPDENLALQLRNSELLRLSVTSRLLKLVPFNFSKSSTENSRGESIRHKFTTESNDRKNYGLPVSVRSSYEFNYDTIGYDPSTQGPYVRNVANILRFPPEFSGPTRSVRRFKTMMSGEAPPIEDPFRPFVRSLLEMDNSVSQSTQGYQQKLSVNKIFTIDPSTGNYGFRNLTPHPDDPGTAVVSSVANVTAWPPTTAAGQEYWARRDRQQLARDIYVLLYLLGHGDDSKSTATTANASPSLTTNGTTLYSEPQLREMAQFAVNVVDAMDRDNVMTRFEYDKDLSDGWNLDDDPYGTIESGATPYSNMATNYNSNYPYDSAVRGEVYGIESLDLTLNEAMVINTVALTTGNSSNQNPGCTPYDDATPRNFAFVELFNRSPGPISFSASEQWQIVLKQDANSGMSVTGFERRLSLGSGAGTVSAGGIYTVGSADFTATGVTVGRSTFKVDPAGGSNTSYLNIAAPSNIAAPAGLDLIDEASNGTLTGKARIEDQTGADITSTAGAWANGFGSSPPASPNMKVVLRRRAHPTRSRLAAGSVNDNPWVDVDVMQVNVGSFSLADVGTPGSGTSAANVTMQLKNLYSIERPQPLGRSSEQAYSTSSGSNVYNSLLSTNNNPTNPPPSPFTLWQPHFDREFASLGELFQVPVYAPYQLTMVAANAQAMTPEKQIQTPTLATTAVGVSTDWPYAVAGNTPTNNAISALTAAAKFLVPEDPSNFTGMTFNRYLDNRWHRVLEFLEVPTRTNYNLGLGSDISIARVPGKINPNMLRHPDILAALIDDKNVAMLNLSPSVVPADSSSDPIATIDDQLGEYPGRDWWQQFVLSRDGSDPYWQMSSSLQIPLPGIPGWPSQGIQGARPFRSLADVGYNYNATTTTQPHASIDDTILRSLPADTAANPLSRRRLLEIGTQAEYAGGNIDPVVRHRLLSKVLGNTTPRSNCYAIFISVKYFSAVSQSGAIRIGGPYNGKPDPEHRGFFVVDRSKIEQGRTSNAMGYDFRSFVGYRKTLATQ